jgi:hypothetical protein
MPRYNLIAVAAAAALLSACAQPVPTRPVAGHDPIRDTSRQLSSVDQVLRQIQNLQRTIDRF